MTKSAIFLRIALHLLTESLMENFIFLAVMFTLRFRNANAFLGQLHSAYDFPNLTLLCLKYT